MPVWRRPVPRRQRGQPVFALQVFFRHFNAWAAVPLRLALSLIHFSMLLSVARYMLHDMKRTTTTEETIPSVTVGIFVLVVSGITIGFDLLGVWTGRTLRSASLNTFHLVSDIGATAYLVWVCRGLQSMKEIYIYYYIFGLLPAVVEVVEVLRSVKRGLD